MMYFVRIWKKKSKKYFEVEKAKEKLDINLPIHLAVRKTTHAPVLLRLPGRVRRQRIWRSVKWIRTRHNMALSGPTLASVVKPGMKYCYQRALTGRCRDDVDPQWLPRTCCTKHAKYDKTTPGLFKVEYEGDVMNGLCSKTYIVQKTKTVPTSNTRMAAFRLLRRAKKLPVKRFVHCPRQVREVKFSSKGITKRRVQAPMTTFRHVPNTSDRER